MPRRGLARLVVAVVLAGVAVGWVKAAEAATVGLNAWYVLVNRNSGKAMDDYNFATNDGAVVVQWGRHNHPRRGRLLLLGLPCTTRRARRSCAPMTS